MSPERMLVTAGVRMIRPPCVGSASAEGGLRWVRSMQRSYSTGRVRKAWHCDAGSKSTIVPRRSGRVRCELKLIVARHPCPLWICCTGSRARLPATGSSASWRASESSRVGSTCASCGLSVGTASPKMRCRRARPLLFRPIENDELIPVR